MAASVCPENDVTQHDARNKAIHQSLLVTHRHIDIMRATMAMASAAHPHLPTSPPIASRLMSSMKKLRLCN